MRDEVDELLEAWGRERGDLDLAPVGVFSRVSRLARRLELARRDAFAAHGIEQWEFDVLAALRRAGAPYELSPGRLLRETLVTSGTMTNRVDRLSARGLVERYPDPDDRRGVIVRLTSEGKATVDAAFAALLEAERELLDTLPERDRAKLASLLRALLAPFADSAHDSARRLANDADSRRHSSDSRTTPSRRKRTAGTTPSRRKADSGTTPSRHTTTRRALLEHLGGLEPLQLQRLPLGRDLGQRSGQLGEPLVVGGMASAPRRSARPRAR